MTEPIRWGILSTANIGVKKVIPAIQKSKNGMVTAIASRNYDRAQEVASMLNIPTAYGDYEALLADDTIDAIYIPLPNQLHAEWAIKCAEAGKPTLCEKPLASTADEAQTMVDAFAEKDILFAEAFMYRFHPQNQRARQMIHEGAIGTPQIMNATFSFALTNRDNIRLSADLAGGALMDVGCYCINSMRFITGEEPTKVAALANFGAETNVDEQIAGILEFPSGLRGHFDASLTTYKVHTYDIRGTEGRIVLPTSFVPNDDQHTVIQHWQGDTYQEIEIEAVDQYQLMVEDFADALLNNRAPKFSPQDAVDNMRVVDRLLASARAHHAEV
ncbi:MAG: Gfo/Idh/MocA family oxidoreductase [Phototrophicaceae bacterium]